MAWNCRKLLANSVRIHRAGSMRRKTGFFGPQKMPIFSPWCHTTFVEISGKKSLASHPRKLQMAKLKANILLFTLGWVLNIPIKLILCDTTWNKRTDSETRFLCSNSSSALYMRNFIKSSVLQFHHLNSWDNTGSQYKIYFFFFRPHHAGCRILVHRPGIKPSPPSVEAWSFNHWTAREIPQIFIFLGLPWWHSG